MKHSYNMLLAVCLFLPCAAAFGNTNLSAQVEREVKNTHLAHMARVEIGVKWKKNEAYRVRRRTSRGSVAETKFRTFYKNTSCVGVLLNNGYVVTASACVHHHDGFVADELTLSFSNGKQEIVKGRKVRVKGDIAHIHVEDSVTQGVVGMEVGCVQEGVSLQDVYGKEFTSSLQQFLVARGVDSPRAARMSGHTTDLMLGEPFIWKGKVVALFNSVPSHLPVSLFGQISEDYLSVFRA